MAMQNLPLAGVKVIDYSQFLADPFISCCLAQMGAEVIKVARPTAGYAGRTHGYFKDGQSGYDLQQNMGKSGLCINLKDERGVAVLRKLVDGISSGQGQHIDRALLECMVSMHDHVVQQHTFSAGAVLPQNRLGAERVRLPNLPFRFSDYDISL